MGKGRAVDSDFGQVVSIGQTRSGSPFALAHEFGTNETGRGSVLDACPCLALRGEGHLITKKAFDLSIWLGFDFPSGHLVRVFSRFFQSTNLSS